MFPLYDDNPTEIFPLFTVGILLGTVAVWVWVQGAGFDPQGLVGSVCAYGAIPAEVTGAVGEGEVGTLGPGLECRYGGLTWEAIFSSIFFHGSWLHLIGNMWFLWIFGNNIEDSMGHLRFLLFYVLTGGVAAGTHIALFPDSGVPMVGASGAISAIMGAYLLLYPRARVRTLLVIVIFITFVDLPAWLYLGYWFLIQLFASTASPGGGGGGVAFWAHVGGFVAGLFLVKIFAREDLVQAKRAHVKLPRSRIRRGGWW